MTFEEFLAYIREHVGHYCTDEYWEMTYNHLPEKTEEYIKKEVFILAVHAIGTDYASKHV